MDLPLTMMMTNKIQAAEGFLIMKGSSSANSAEQSHKLDQNATISGTREQVFSVPLFKRLLTMNLPEWKEATLGCIGAILFGGVQPLYGFAMGSMISVYFLPSHDDIKEKIKIYALCFLGLAFFCFFVNVLQHYNFDVIGEKLTTRVRERMLTKMLTFEIGWYDKEENSTGAVCSRLANDANVVRSLVGDRMSLLIQTTSAVTIACTMGLVIAWRLAWVMITAQPLIIVCHYCKRMLLRRMSKKFIEAQEESSKLAAEAVSNLRTVTTFSSQARILQMLKKAQEGPQRESIRQSWSSGFGLCTSNSLMTCTWALAFWYGGEGHIGAKDFFHTYLILVSTGRVIADAGTMNNDLAKGEDAAGSVFAVLDQYSLIEPEHSDGLQAQENNRQCRAVRCGFCIPC